MTFDDFDDIPIDYGETTSDEDADEQVASNGATQIPKENTILSVLSAL